MIGDNRKMLIFPLSELPEMTRGRGIKLQSYKDGGLRDAMTFAMAEGLTVRTGGRHRTFEQEEIANGSASARRPVACRRKVFRAPNTFS